LLHGLYVSLSHASGQRFDGLAIAIQQQPADVHFAPVLSLASAQRFQQIRQKLLQALCSLLDLSSAYCLEMICADFLAGANLDDQNPETMLCSMTRFFKFLPGELQQVFLENLREKAS
jgi:hypothetical protein